MYCKTSLTKPIAYARDNLHNLICVQYFAIGGITII